MRSKTSSVLFQSNISNGNSSFLIQLTDSTFFQVSIKVAEVFRSLILNVFQASFNSYKQKILLATSVLSPIAQQLFGVLLLIRKRTIMGTIFI